MQEPLLLAVALQHNNTTIGLLRDNVGAEKREEVLLLHPTTRVNNSLLFACGVFLTLLSRALSYLMPNQPLGHPWPLWSILRLHLDLEPRKCPSILDLVHTCHSTIEHSLESYPLTTIVLTLLPPLKRVFVLEMKIWKLFSHCTNVFPHRTFFKPIFPLYKYLLAHMMTYAFFVVI